MAKRIRWIAVASVVVAICCGGPILGGYALFISPNRPFTHAYPAPGPGCGDTGELESGVRVDNWENEDYAGVHCYPDHVDIDAGHDPDPRGVHTIGANVFPLESDIDGPSISDLSRDRRKGFRVTVTVHVRSGGPDARAGITVRPNVPLRAAANAVKYPVYFFNVDLAGRWKAATHDDFGAFLSNLDSSTATASIPAPADRVLTVLFDLSAGTLSFAVDGIAAATVHPPEFDTYRIGVGVACSYDPQHSDNCLVSAKDYRYEVIAG